MTASYAAFREAVRSAVVAASGLADTAVVWEQNGEPVADPLIVLTAISDLRTNDCPVRETLDLSEDGTYYTRELSEMRDVAVQVRVESIRTDALGLANEIALKLGWAATREILEAECRVIEDPGPLRDLRYRSRDLWVQARAFDFRLRIVLSSTDPTPVPTIGTVLVQGVDVAVTPEETTDLPEDTINEDDEIGTLFEFTTEFTGEYVA